MKKSFGLINVIWACSSVVEHYVDIVEVISSILITPTIKINNYNSIYIFAKKYYKALPGNYCEGATPDPIPNSEVKSFSANGTLS